MEDFKIVVDNLQEFINNGMQEYIQKGLTDACLLVEGSAKRNAPSRDGQLRQSITHDIEDFTGYVGTNLEYAPYVEIGTGIHSSEGTGREDVPWRYKDEKTGQWYTTYGQESKPFLQPAVEENKQEIMKCFKELF